MSWSYAYAFRAGDGHERCDDVCVCETLGDYIIAAVADGAGSAPKAHEGAALACQKFIELAIPLFSGSLDAPCLVSAIHEKLPAGKFEDYACTLVGVVAGPKGAFILQVGDGGAVVRLASAVEAPTVGREMAGTAVKAQGEAAGGTTVMEDVASQGSYTIPLWPEETEFLNHTFFITAPDAEEHLQIHRIEEPVHEIALFTDGLQHLIIDRKSKSPHQPFFNTIFRPLSAEPDQDIKASWWLERQLASDHVTKRTDDDTSIVIARRLRC